MNYPDDFGHKPCDTLDPRSPMCRETLEQKLREAAEPPDVIDVEHQEPMLTVDQVLDILSET